jgi:UDP-4-amino-4,6-dideoxy-N-acetyl-beta-L-altrosamine transaminase
MKFDIRCNEHQINNIDILSVNKVLKSSNLTQGKKVKLFENDLAGYVNSRYALVLNSCTSALFLACKVIGIKKNDIVWTTPISFVATSNSALYCEANVDFIDIDYKTLNIDLDLFEKKLINSKKKPKLVIIVHLGGNVIDYEKIKYLKKKYNFKIIEDACHALGSKFHNEKVGSCKYSDITCFSFHAIKNITTGEGGAVTTNKKIYFDKINLLRTHGINKKNVFNKILPPDLFYQQSMLGFNFRMTDIQSSLGISQLKRLNSNINRRHALKKLYCEGLKNIHQISFQKENNFSYNANHLFIIKISNKLRNKLYYFLKKKKIECKFHYIPIYRHQYYKKLFNKKNKIYKNSEKYFRNGLSLPMHNNLKKKDVKKIIKNIRTFFYDKN